MKQGRKSKTVLALVCMLGSLLAFSALAPVASAQGPAESEYDLGPLPGADGDTPAGETQTGGTAAPQAADDESGGAGASTLLILLVAVAAVCTGLAIWRLRRGDDTDDDPRGVGPTTGERQSV